VLPPPLANVAVTVVSAESVTTQGSVPVQPAPVQPVKVELPEGAAVKVTAVPAGNAPGQEPVEQLMPAGELVTVPVPAPATATVRLNVEPSLTENVAVTLRTWDIFTEQEPVPVQAPPQPPKMELLAGAALSVTDAPESKFATHLAPQLMPDGLEVTVPVPWPSSVTFSANCVLPPSVSLLVDGHAHSAIAPASSKKSFFMGGIPRENRRARK
jgi:hypothetical protein